YYPYIARYVSTPPVACTPGCCPTAWSDSSACCNQGDLPSPMSSVNVAVEQQTMDNSAHLRVMVPPDATEWFNGVLTEQKGTERSFVSPAITPGQDYTYEIRARWISNGQPVDERRTIHIQANQWNTIDFTPAGLCRG